MGEKLDSCFNFYFILVEMKFLAKVNIKGRGKRGKVEGVGQEGKRKISLLLVYPTNACTIQERQGKRQKSGTSSESLAQVTAIEHSAASSEVSASRKLDQKKSSWDLNGTLMSNVALSL